MNELGGYLDDGVTKLDSHIETSMHSLGTAYRHAEDRSDFARGLVVVGVGSLLAGLGFRLLGRRAEVPSRAALLSGGLQIGVGLALEIGAQNEQNSILKEVRAKVVATGLSELSSLQE